MVSSSDRYWSDQSRAHLSNRRRKDNKARYQRPFSSVLHEKRSSAFNEGRRRQESLEVRQMRLCRPISISDELTIASPHLRAYFKSLSFNLAPILHMVCFTRPPKDKSSLDGVWMVFGACGCTLGKAFLTFTRGAAMSPAVAKRS